MSKDFDKRLRPPLLASKLFRFYCKNDLADSILGDMEEEFRAVLAEKGRFWALFRYWFNVFLFINRHTLSKRKSARTHSNVLAMIKNYLTIAFRNVKRKPVFSFINIFGLAVGLATFLVIFLHVQHETSFDSFHEKSGRIYRVVNTFERSTSISKWVRTPPALAPAIRDNFPGVGKVTRMRSADDQVCYIGNQSFRVSNGLYADSVFFQIFDFRLALGNQSTALNQPNSIVLTKALASRFFGEENPIGKTIALDNLSDLQVTGVLERLPTNSHISFDYLISFSTYVVPDGYLADLNSWSWGGFYTYILLDEGISASNLEAGVNEIFRENYPSDLIKVSAQLQPLERLYLGYPEFTNLGDSMRIGSKPTIYVLSGIATLVLLVAGLNFMNLSTAMSLGRGKEIGMRKVLGAVRSRIRLQFLIESASLALFSMLIALFLVYLGKDSLNNYLDLKLPLDVLSYLKVLPVFTGFALVVGLLSGLYPSVILAALKPLTMVKGNFKSSNKGNTLRKVLTVFQFIVSVGLISVSLIIMSQTNYMLGKPLGFETENVLAINLFEEDMEAHYTVLKDRLSSNPYVKGVARTSHIFNGDVSIGPARLEGASDEESYQLKYYQTGYDFQSLLGMSMEEGRFFSRDFPNDTADAIVLNRSAVQLLDMENPLGERILMHGRTRRVIGVISDFNISSLHNPMDPLAIVMPFTNLSTMLIGLSTDDMSAALGSIETDWKAVVENAPFDITFLDQEIGRMYEQEQRLSNLIWLFSILAIVLASLGLYGLVTFSIRQRMKEVGIRKVLGAKVSTMVGLLSAEFLWLVLFSNIIAIPIIYWVAQNWLSGFSYRIEIGATMFVFPMLLLVLIAMVTISYQVIKSALLNPVKVLRDE